jgi:hypothetical protein
MKKLTTIFFLFLALTAKAQFGMQPATGFQWNASWIGVPGAGISSPGGVPVS